MENPVVISKEDWSLGAHQLGFIYDSYDGTTEGSAKVIDELKAGTLKAEDYDRFNEFMDTFDLLSQYNINGEDPLGALYDQDPIFLADGDAALWINGCWAWPNLKEAGASDSDEYGFLPYILGNDTSDFANNGIQASASKQLMIDAEQSTPRDGAAAMLYSGCHLASSKGLAARGRQALELGANDYITKPFGTGELLARVRAALRTNRFGVLGGMPGGVFRAQGLEINYERRKVFVDGAEIKLTQTEYNIVAFLSEHAGRVMTYAAIVRAIWGDTDCGSTKKLQVNMANIRKKLGSVPGRNTYILNELGVGYRMIDEDTDARPES